MKISVGVLHEMSPKSNSAREIFLDFVKIYAGKFMFLKE